MGLWGAFRSFGINSLREHRGLLHENGVKTFIATTSQAVHLRILTNIVAKTFMPLYRNRLGSNWIRPLAQTPAPQFEVFSHRLAVNCKSIRHGSSSSFPLLSVQFSFTSLRKKKKNTQKLSSWQTGRSSRKTS